jgi:sarcosine oxidase
MRRADVMIIGLGAVGSAAAYHLAKQGKQVRGFDSFAPPHRMGSSHGETRITRLAIGEGAEYSPLAMRSHQLWRDMERQTGATLLVNCGGLIISNETDVRLNHGISNFLGNTFEAARRHGIAHQRLSSAEMRERFPQFNVEDHEIGYYEPSAGYLHVEACIEAQLALARDTHGAELHPNTPAASFRSTADGVEVITAAGHAHVADQLLVSAGAWLPRLLASHLPRQDLFTVTRQVMHWFEVRSHRERFSNPSFPIFIWEPPRQQQPIYGFPPANCDPAAGMKIATEVKDVVDPDAVDRHEPPERIASTFREHIAPWFPDLGPRSIKTAVCLYTEVKGGRFVVDRLPAMGRVLFASACSGHGFKHSAALGEALAQLLTTGRSAVDLSCFSLARLAMG